MAYAGPSSASTRPLLVCLSCHRPLAYECARVRVTGWTSLALCLPHGVCGLALGCAPTARPSCTTQSRAAVWRSQPSEPGRGERAGAAWDCLPGLRGVSVAPEDPTCASTASGAGGCGGRGCVVEPCRTFWSGTATRSAAVL